MTITITRLIKGLATALVIAAASPAVVVNGENGSEYTSKVDLSYLVNGRRPIWLGPVIRYTVHEATTVEARISALSGELVLVMPLGLQQPGQHTLPWNGTTDDGLSIFEGKYFFELFFGDEYAAKFWIMSKSTESFNES